MERESKCRTQLFHLFRELCVGLFQSIYFGLEVVDRCTAIRNITLVTRSSGCGRKSEERACAAPQMSVQLFDVVLLIQNRCDLTVAERAKPEQNSRTCYSGFGIHMYKRTKKINDPSLIAGCPAFSLKHPNWDRNMLTTNYLLTEQMKSTNDDEIKMGGEGGPALTPLHSYCCVPHLWGTWKNQSHRPAGVRRPTIRVKTKDAGHFQLGVFTSGTAALVKVRAPESPGPPPSYTDWHRWRWARRAAPRWRLPPPPSSARLAHRIRCRDKRGVINA